MKLTKDISPEQRDWRNNDQVWMTCRQNHIISYAQQGDWLRNIASDPTIQMFGIEVGYDTNIGTCGLTSINYHHGTAEFSLLIAPAYQGKKYSKPALILLLDYGFNRLRLETIWGDVMENNIAVQIFENMGFNNCGLLRSRYFKGRKRIGTYAIDMTRKEFNERYSIGYIEEIKKDGT